MIYIFPKSLDNALIVETPLWTKAYALEAEGSWNGLPYYRSLKISYLGREDCMMGAFLPIVASIKEENFICLNKKRTAFFMTPFDISTWTPLISDFDTCLSVALLGGATERHKPIARDPAGIIARAERDTVSKILRLPS